MSKLIKCDQCNGEWPYIPSRWIKVKYELMQGAWNNAICPDIGGDYCSLECLLEKVTLAIEEYDQIKVGS